MLCNVSSPILDCFNCKDKLATDLRSFFLPKYDDLPSRFNVVPKVQK